MTNTKPFVRPSIVFDPNLTAGIDMMANAIKSTLGPLPRKVGVERADRTRMPELLDDAGIIARRIVQIRNPTEDVGAMMLRHGMWRMHERVGDGAATMAVLAQAMLHEANKGLAAAMHPMLIRRGIDAATHEVVAELRRLAKPLPPGKKGRELLKALAVTLSSDTELMDAIVTVVNTIGSDGMVEIKVNDRRTVDYEYVEGATWNSGWVSPAYVVEGSRTISRLEDVAVVVIGGSIDTEEQAIAGIECLAEMELKRVALVAGDISEEALRVFTHVHLQGSMRFVIIKAPFVDAERATALYDMGALTSARVLIDVSEFMSLTPADVGFARRVWATGIKCGIIAGQRMGDALRGRIDDVRHAVADFNDKKAWDDIRKLRWRLAQLTGGTAVLQVGDLTKPLADTRKEHAERMIQVLQLASDQGVVTGGGSALLACAHVVNEAIQHCDDPDIRFGMQSVERSLVAPVQVIAHNAGFDSGAIRSLARQAPDGYGFDARTGAIVDMWQSGIVDPLYVIERAIQTAASIVGMATTTTAVVHQKKSYPGPVVP